MPSESSTAVLTPDGAEQELHRFRGATLEEAVAHARRQLGEDVQPRAASRLRQGGLLGFFAKDLGVEVTVERGAPVNESPLDDVLAASALGDSTDAAESVDRVLERLVGEATATERVTLTATATPAPQHEPVFAQLLARALERAPAETPVRDKPAAMPLPADPLTAAASAIADRVGAAVRAARGQGDAEGVLIVPVVIVVDGDGRIRDGAARV